MKVANKGCIRRLSLRNMRASRGRNVIAVIAIALTTMLFTSLFTIVMSVIHGYEMSNFRQVGGYQHAGLKRITEEQYLEFRDDPRIEEYAKRVFLGTVVRDGAFLKADVEVSSIDENYAKFGLISFENGGLPAENTMEAAADSRVLKLLGVEPEIGAEFTVELQVGEHATTQTFTLCGWWEFDDALPVGNIFLPYSRTAQIIDDLGIEPGSDGYTGAVSLDFMLKSGSSNIEEEVCAMIRDHGYECNTTGTGDGISYGVNWGYLSAQTDNLMDLGTAAALAILLIVIVLTGYLIIYNVFRISVTNDIRFYGLLKTIGTTGSQIRRIIAIQAVLLSLIGIPVGLILGYGVGVLLTPAVLSNINVVNMGAALNPAIFLFSALFSFGTVVLSCIKPGRIAAKISPVEAVRYTESKIGRRTRRAKKGASLTAMAMANLSRSRSKTVITIVSLALSAVLLNLTVIFANSFDMDKYLRSMPVDLIAADNVYFNYNQVWSEEDSLHDEDFEAVFCQDFITGGGRTYGTTEDVSSFVPGEHLVDMMSEWDTEIDGEEYLSHLLQKDGLYSGRVQLYGMDDFCLEKLILIDGDVSKIRDGSGYVAAVYTWDDYGKIEENSNWAQVGDKVTMIFHDSWESVWVDPVTWEVYGEKRSDVPEGRPAARMPKESHTADYEVAAVVVLPHYVSYRFYTASDQFIMNSADFQAFTGSDSVMYGAFDIEDGSEARAENFINSYIDNVAPLMEYQSKSTLSSDFDSFRGMFLLLGGVMSFIVGIVGVLNFINVVLTGIIARRKEHAVLQSIGMTGRQLTQMLVTEGLIYTVTAGSASLVLFLLTAPLLKRGVETVFWFISFRFTIVPILLLLPVFAAVGAIIPIIARRAVSGRSIVQRLREAE